MMNAVTTSACPPVMQRYAAVLEALFDASLPPPVPLERHARFIAERERRLLNIGRTMARCWPLTFLYEQALYGREFVEGTAAQIPGLIDTATTMTAAIDEAARRWQSRLHGRTSRELFRLEQSLRSPIALDPAVATRAERARLAALGLIETQVLDFGIDVIALAQALDFLSRNAAGPSHYASVVPDPRPMRLGFGRRAERRMLVVLRPRRHRREAAP
ncbi:MAG: hypothetical protein ACOY82_15075 [Pseudomonadota bacterium]